MPRPGLSGRDLAVPGNRDLAGREVDRREERSATAYARVPTGAADECPFALGDKAGG